MGLGTVFFTAMYVFKGITSVFREGPPGADDGATHVAPSFLSGPHVIAVVVMVAVTIAVLLGTWSWFAAFLAPAVGSAGDAAAISFEGSAWILVPIAVAACGWALAWSQGARPGSAGDVAWRKRLYVFFLNKGYFDEVYDAVIVRPFLALSSWLWRRIDQGVIDRAVLSLAPVTIAMASWLWRRIDQHIIDRAVLSLAPVTIAMASWLWRRVDQQVIDRIVLSVGSGSVGAARELGERVDTAGIERAVDRIGEGVEASGRVARRYEPNTLQHNLLVVVILLVLALGFFYSIG